MMGCPSLRSTSKTLTEHYYISYAEEVFIAENRHTCREHSTTEIRRLPPNKKQQQQRKKNNIRWAKDTRPHIMTNDGHDLHKARRPHH